ncbi:low molecular weight protein tyrosine phosphatase family protein [Caulobacter sp. 1776]|uniref:low molecular weight protein tyrosine phosphatase family protein n=1 Tax=Caulobacter sp. 1776 TaxID=3156420 RepID=UPI003396D2E3
MNVLFVCSQNKLRSPTAEQVFANWPGIEVASAGLDDGCGNPVTPEALEWANLVLVMEQAHRNKLSRRFKPHLKNARVIVLGIPDDYEFMDPELVRILEAKVPQFLRR